jgi:hypothetical protein
MQHGIDLVNISISRLGKCHTTHQSACLTRPLKLAEERHLQLALAMVVGVERLEDLVQALEKKGPEIVKQAKVVRTVGNMSRIVVVWFGDAGSVELVPSSIQY